MKTRINILLTFAIIASSIACKKILDIDPPVNTVVTEVAFQNDNNAISAVSGIYRNLLVDKNNSFNSKLSNGAMTISCGLSSDELFPFTTNDVGDVATFNNNLINGDESTGFLSSDFWNPTFFGIYQTNACLEGLKESKGVSGKIKSRLAGELKFIRAFSYFNLTNLFGDIPYTTSSKWNLNNNLSNIPQMEIYQYIVDDLNEAIMILPDNYSASNSERIIANKWAAIALMARVQLYLKRWSDAEKYASLLLDNNSLFSLNVDLNSVYSKNNQEAILQWQINPNDPTTGNSTVEGCNVIPYQEIPIYCLTSNLLNAFEPNDKRRSDWIKSIVYQGTTYYYPFKYKLGIGERMVGAVPTEYYMIFRLAEQYLIRAEARAHLNKLTGAGSAASDLNAIRNRAGLGNSIAITQPELLAAIVQERRIELFAEWGHRWLDLKRTGKVNEVLAPIKPMWKPHQQYYPIPFSELQLNPNLTPTPGY